MAWKVQQRTSDAWCKMSKPLVINKVIIKHQTASVRCCLVPSCKKHICWGVNFRTDESISPPPTSENEPPFAKHKITKQDDESLVNHQICFGHGCSWQKMRKSFLQMSLLSVGEIVAGLTPAHLTCRGDSLRQNHGQTAHCPRSWLSLSRNVKQFVISILICRGVTNAF